MGRTHMTADEATGPGTAPAPPAAPIDAAATQRDAKIRDEELYRMAAFRIRETANRVATLARSVRDERLRAELLAVCERLLAEERALLGLSRP